MKVRATRFGFYDKKRKEGDVFVLAPKEGHKQAADGSLVPHTFTAEEQFSKKWMEKVEEKSAEPKKK